MMHGIADRLLAATEGLLSLPFLWRKPATANICIRRAKTSGAALTVWLILLIWVVPPAVTSTLNSVYPEQSKLLGLVKTQHPEIDQMESRISMALWIGSGGLIVLLLGLALSRTMREAANESLAMEREADAASDPAYRVARYRMAYNLETNALRAAELQKKIRAVQNAPGESASLTMAASKSSTSEATTYGISGDSGAVRGPDRYQIVRELGRGSMGVVYEAADPLLDRRVALKKLPAWLAGDPSLIARFKQEARALARISHPGIVQVYDLLETTEALWIVLEMIDGGDLSGVLQHSGPLSESHAVALGTGMAEALEYAHQSEVIHRDFKPANVLLTPDQQTKITDFGIAKIAAGSDLTHDGAIIGSPRYMSPEQAAGKPADHRADIYALGVCLYEMVSGSTPFNGDTAEVLTQCITQDPIPVNRSGVNVSDSFNEIVMRMLVKQPEKRIQSMQSVAKALHGCFILERTEVKDTGL